MADSFEECWDDDVEVNTAAPFYDVSGNLKSVSNSLGHAAAPVDNNNGYKRGKNYNGASRERRNYGGGWASSSHFSDEIRVPEIYLGRILGKGGAIIKSMQTEMSVRINIKRNMVDENGDVAVNVSGSDRSNVDATVEKIKKLTNWNKQNTIIASKTRNNFSYENKRGFGRRGYGDRNNDARPRNSHFGGQNEDDYDDRQSNSSSPGVKVTEIKEEKKKVRVDWGQAKKDLVAHQEAQMASYGPIKKDFYEEDPEVSAMTKQQVAAARKEHQNIVVESLVGLKTYSYLREEEGDVEERVRLAEQDHIHNPILTFHHAFHKYPAILSEIERNGFKNPSPIQMQAWPVIMAGRDLIGIAQTGTGKTLAFLLPAFIHIQGQPVPRHLRKGPTVLILTPTRELALQIEQEVKKYSYEGIKCVCVYGGGSRREQVGLVKEGTEIVVATPGRLQDLMDSKLISLESVSYLVLDEADRMLDLGFEPAIRGILIDVRMDRQTIMTSATWPRGVRKLACSYQKDPIQVFVGSLDLAAVHSVEQRVVMVEEDSKLEELKDFFHSELLPDSKVLVFMGRKATVDHVHATLSLEGDIVVQSIHGGHEQADREQALNDLKTGAVRILLATDVASRGIDVKDLSHVVNYDLPRNMEEYVHRVGRTGRAGRQGIAVSFVSRDDWGTAQKLIDILQEADQHVPTELLEMAQRFKEKKSRDFNSGSREYGGRGGFGGKRNFEKGHFFDELENFL